MMDQRRVVITADDLGLSAENNAGIFYAHREGIVSTASLMVGGDAVEEALAMLPQHPNLSVGLHVTFSDTRPILPPEEVPLLVTTEGRFPADDYMHKAALRSVKGQRQIRAEIAAQFRAFYATGLTWDHVNTHRHVHRHPLLALMLFHEAQRWSVPATRIPWDPPADPLRHMRVLLLRQMAHFHKLVSPERSIGRDWTVEGLTTLLMKLPTGITEIYFHPVTAQDHMFAADLPTLLDVKVRAALAQLTVCPGLRYACLSSTKPPGTFHPGAARQV
jgi:predicted glycoside hydrolase/deacetylase ChbG (UPF0249 family)